ncbi:hypothetical protein [Pseudomonas viridiflava]|uniref:Uncharacterized protein n=1 Tax=Pseudomonas viridiflava TaxID=33069 RepID=A0A3M5P3X9_PSEVI|nr:hypothetical protein [Pseudomonas viridiflava]RMT79194.1 hypothetical protein ALP40_01497 [Pseudomonas viridiflava]
MDWTPKKSAQARYTYITQRRVRMSKRATQLVPATVVEAMAGDADGLLPITALANDLAITVPDWRLTSPPPGFTEELHLEWRPEGANTYVKLSTETLTTPIKEEFPLPRVIERKHFLQTEGTFQFRYGVKLWSSGEVEYSQDQPITVDRTPPYGPVDPPAVEDPGPINDAALDAQGGVFVTVPDFEEEKKEFVKVVVLWSNTIPPADQPIIPDVEMLLPADRRVLIPRELVERYASGDHYVAYELFDKAGNRSRPSRVRTVAVARGPLPAGLKPPVVPLAADGLIDLGDAHLGVTVEIPAFEDFHPDDDVVVTWGATQLTPKRIGEGDNPFPVEIVVSWDHLSAEYTAPETAPFTSTVPVTYTVMRGTTPFALPDADAIDVDVNLAYSGPVNPHEPNPVNPDLEPVIVTGESGETNELTENDKGKDAKATVTLHAPTRSGEVITLYWNGVAVTNTVTLTGAEVEGDNIELTIAWGEIEAGGSGNISVYYSITHPDFINPQQSTNTTVVVDAVPIVLAAATFPDVSVVSGTDILNCESLHKRSSDEAIGYRVSIPASEYLVAGDEIALKWVLKDSDAITDVAGTLLTATMTIDADAHTNGMQWFVEPYSTYILPVHEGSEGGWGYAQVIYTLTVGDKAVDSQFINTLVAIQDLEGEEGTCAITSLREIP